MMRIPKEAKIIFMDKVVEEIEEKVSWYAKIMYTIGVNSKTSIGVYLERTPESMLIMLAAIKLGVPFLPLDIKLPLNRIYYMLEDSNIEYVVTERKNSHIFENYKKVFIDDANLKIDEIHNESEVNEIIYILYTSGTTGVPKGVEIRREGFFSFVNGVSKIIDFRQGRRIACFTQMTFDIFFLESIMALYKGLTVVLASEKECTSVRLTAKLLVKQQVDMLQITPSRLQLILKYDEELKCLDTVSDIMIGGEKLSNKLKNILQVNTSARIYNMYGPTETTIWSTISELTHSDVVDIGNPIEGTRVYILNEKLLPVKDGDMGEICIGGKGVARGYVNKPELTQNKFVWLPEPVNERVYCTGDLGKYDNGVLFYVGRRDNQIKYHGQRIELEEIEQNIIQFCDVEQVVVSLYDDKNGCELLVAFYTSKKDIDKIEFKEKLSSVLPRYMVPGRYVRLSKMPCNSNGKIDRALVAESGKKIIKCFNNAFERLECRKEAIEEDILKIIKKNMSFNDFVTIQSTFADLSLDSITYMKIVVDIEEFWNIEFDDNMLLMSSFPDVQALADYIKKLI